MRSASLLIILTAGHRGIHQRQSTEGSASAWIYKDESSPDSPVTSEEEMRAKCTECLRGTDGLMQAIGGDRRFRCV